MHPKVQSPGGISCDEQLLSISNHRIMVKIYRSMTYPSKTLYSLGSKPEYPTIIFIHGTGYVANEYNFSDLNCRYFVKGTNAQVINIHLSIAPEWMWPNTFDDVYSIYKLITTCPELFQVDPKKIVAVGYSSGATLIAQLMMKAKLTSLPQQTSQILVGPMVDFSY
jgi:acetyl esterase